MTGTKLSALTELAASPANDDEIYIRDISEPSADESKRIVMSNLLGALPATILTGTITGAAQVLSNLGTVYIGDTSDAFVTLGLVINMAGADNHIISLKSSDINHSITDLAEADTFGYLGKMHATSGGVRLAGWSTGFQAVQLLGGVASGDTTKSTSAQGIIALNAYEQAGNGIVVPGANVNLVVITAAGTTRFILDAEGDLWLGGGVEAIGQYKISGTQVVSAQGAAVADPTDAASTQARLTDLLGRLRTHGLIAT